MIYTARSKIPHKYAVQTIGACQDLESGIQRIMITPDRLQYCKQKQTAHRPSVFIRYAKKGALHHLDLHRGQMRMNRRSKLGKQHRTTCSRPIGVVVQLAVGGVVDDAVVAVLT